ncbi:MAG TPA: carboxypeptidase regulatory-like domain-containing protein [Candidatus Acidoferrum sp.]|nr:carboxypeptidase regulatory-like domain-containing protein [Candidatus Acidoferrum sp.]
MNSFSDFRNCISHLISRRGLTLVCGFALLLLILPANVHGQAVSRINGTVADQAEAAVPDAKVTVTNVDTNVSKDTTTTSAGTYLVIDLIPGTYTVKVEKAGFKTFVSTNVTVVGGATSTVNATLQPGTVTETVEVIAPAVALQTEQPEIGTTINETLTQELPQLISGQVRQIDNFIFLTPGVTGNGFSHRINGGVDQQTEVMFNGVPEAFSETAGFTQWNQPPYDSIKDADILTGTFSAQYGLGQGVEQYHTKSGTNVVHGDVFFLYRDDKYLAAPGAFNDINPNNVGKIDQPNTNIESNVGFSVGGPVWIPKIYDGRNKTFWFFSFDRFRQSFVPNVVTLPTQAELSGDFSALVDPSNPTTHIPIFVPTAWGSNPALIPSGCTIPGFATPQAAAGQQFPGNKIPSSCFSQVSAGILKQFPLPSPSNPNSEVNNYTPATTSLNLEKAFSVNIDHNLTSKQAVHGLFWRQRYPQPNSGDWVNSPLSNLNVTTLLARGLDITYSNAISSRMVLTGGFLYVYQANDFQPPHLLSSPLSAVPPSGLAQPLTFPSIGFGGGLWEPGSWGPGNGLSSTINHKTGYSVLANLLWIKGKHNMNIGVDIRKTLQKDFECGGSGGQPGCSGLLNFTSDITADPNEQLDICGATPGCVSTPGSATGSGFASFLLGNVTTGGRGGAGNTNLRNSYFAPYFQDDMQISAKLKVNWGIRWDVAFPFANDNKTNQLTYFDPKAVNPTEINPKTGQQLLGAMAELGTCSACGGFNTMKMDWHHFSPRIGATYQLNPKTVLLGGVSWYWLDTGAFEYGVNKVAVNYGNNLNGVVSIGQPVPQVPGFGQWDTTQLPPLPAVGFSPTFFNGTSILGFAQVHTLPRHVNQAYNEQFVLGIQRELPWNMFLSVSGVHTHDLHLPATLESGVQSLNYGFVQSACPQGPTVTTTNQCVLAQSWTSSAAQTFMMNQGTFGQVTYPTGSCGNPGGPITYFAPYNNFCQEQGTGSPLFVAELPYPHMPFVTNNFDTSGADKYNALQVSLQKRTGGGLTYLVSYTLSRYLTNTDSGFSTFNFRGINPQNPKAEWSVGNNDQTHVLTIAGVYELPIGPGKKYLNHGGTAMKNIVGGWKISTVNYYESGTPLQTFSCADQFDCDPLIGSIFVGNRPNRVSGQGFGINWNNYYKGTASINKAAFSFPGSWTLGNGAPLYNALRAPPYFDEDMTLGKKFFFGERFSGELTIQFFNVLNRMLLNNGPNNGAGLNCWHGNFTSSHFGNAFNSPTTPCQGNQPRTGQAEFRVFF